MTLCKPHHVLLISHKRNAARSLRRPISHFLMRSPSFILSLPSGFPPAILSPTAVKQMPFSYLPRVIPIPHFLWLGSGGAISWDRWEPDRNNWCRRWKRAPTKHPLFFEKSGEIYSENSPPRWCTSHTQIHCFQLTKRKLWTSEERGAKSGKCGFATGEGRSDRIPLNMRPLKWRALLQTHRRTCVIHARPFLFQQPDPAANNDPHFSSSTNAHQGVRAVIFNSSPPLQKH